MAIVGNIIKGIININYKAIIKVFMEVYFKVIIRKSTIFIRNQIASQPGTLLTSKRRYIVMDTVMLVCQLLRRDLRELQELVDMIEPVESWDEG